MPEMNDVRSKLPAFEQWVWLLFLLALVYKIYACFQVPAVTSDVLRHLGYSSHALDNNFSIYTTKAEDFRPEIWTRYWSNQPYIYPPVTLVFFYLFSVFHLGIFWVKLVLTLIDCGCAYLFYKHISKLAALLFFCAPVSLWYTSHEGQFEILQTLFIILNALSVKKQKWFLSGFWFAISVQVKQFGVLILPWILYETWNSRNENDQSLLKIISKAFQGLILGFLPFLPFYIQSPWLIFLPITSGSTLIYNPFAWNLLNPNLFGWNPKYLVIWNALFSYATFSIIVIVSIIAWKNRKFSISISTVPLTLFWFITKSLKWGQFWYSIVAPSFLFCLSRKSLIHLLLVLHLMQCLHSTIAIFIRPIGAKEPQSSLALMQSCMFRCEPQQLDKQI
jgi:Gpi18-like mannosyltransferase